MSHTSDLARPRRGFNTLELVATLVLVGVLSALGAFGYARFIDDAGHQVDVAEVTAIARKATALGAFNGLETQTETTPDSGEWSDAFDGSDFTVVTGEAVEDNEVVVSDPWTETDGASWSAAAAKVDGECVFAVADSSGNVDVAQAPDGVPCNPAYAAPPSGDGDVGFISEPSAPELPTLTDPEGAFEFDEGNDPSEGAFDVAITWPPADDNGAPVESYTILLSTEPDMSDPVEIVTGTNQTAFVLDDLDRTEDYYVTVAATNRADTGEESDPLAFTTPASPPSPVQNLVGDSGVFASELSWDAPVDDGDSTDGDPADDIAGYTVSVSTDGGQTYTEIADLGSTTTTYTHSDLDGGETYDYQVVAYNDDSDNEEGYPEETTVVAGDAEAPDAPDAPAAAVSGDGILTASWTEPVLNGAPIDEYEVEIDPACTSTFGGSHNGITSTSAHFTGLAGGVGHAFRVRARNAAGWSPFSEVSACTTAHVVPDAPGEDTVVRSDATATITFTAPAFDGGSTITGYVIEVNDGNGWATAADTDGDAADLAATVVLVDDTAPYDVRISATNSVGTGSHIEFTAAIAVLVDAPTVTAVSAGAADVQLSWSTPDAHGETITGYDLEYRFHIDGVGWTNFTTLTSVGATVNAHTHDEFTGGHELVPGVSYEHRVRAAAQSPGNWGTAAPVVPFVALGAPDAPALAIVSASSLDASWTAPDVTGTGQQIGGYELELLDTSLAVVDSASTGASTLTHSFTGLTQGAVYYAKIRAISDVDANPTAWSSLSAGTATATIPNYVQNVAFTGGSSEVTATWDAAVDNGSAITGYDVRLYSCANNGLVSAHDGQPASPTSLTAAATHGTALYARVWATNGIGQSSGATPSACATPYAAPDTPSWVSATAPSAAGSYVLDWAQPANNGDTIDQYHLQMYSCPSGQTFQGQEFIAGESAHQFTWTGATHGMNRKFRVRAQNAAGWGAYSAWSACLGATTMAAPDYVQNVVITGGSSEVTVTWDAAVDNGSAITSYDVRIYFCSTGAAASIKDGQPASPTSFTQVATPGDEVYARVWANNAVGSSSGAYLSACTTIYTTPDAPVPAVSTGDASATVTWPTPAGNGSAVTGYGYRWTCGNGWQPFTSPAYPAGWSYAHLTNSASITGTNANGQSVANGVSCTYQVRAFNAAGASAWG
ncbi:MAG: hypothetical protein GY901_09775, partial [Actinomycetia bacterium]|nr:hypothetical protein [Actinomycetes bacterium]